MKKLSIASMVAVIAALLLVTAAFALVSNGNFELGNFSSWAKSSFINNGFSVAHGAGGSDLSAIVGPAAPLSLSDANTGGVVKYPAYGSYSARVNSKDSYTGGGFAKNGNIITQTVSAVLDPSDNLAHIRLTYAAVMVNPVVGTLHTPDQKPYFRVRVINTSNSNDVVYDFASYVGEPGKNWQTGVAFGGGNFWQYLDWTYIDLSSSVAHPVNASDNITVEITASGCQPGGHPGYVYVDEITDGDIAGPIIKATGPATTYPNASITYTYNYKNGSASAILPVVTATEPAGVTFTSVSDIVNCSLSSGTVTCNFPSLAAGGTGVFTINGTVTAPGSSQIAHGDYNIAAAGFPTVGGQTVFTDVVLNVTINQAAGQSDPTSSSPVHFTAVFTSPVTGFTGTGVSTGTSTVGGTLVSTVTEIAPNDGTTYDVSIAGMTTSGDVIATINESVVPEGNSPSTSTDNVVTFNIITVTINQAGTQADPTTTGPVHFTAVFSSAVTGFIGTDVSTGTSTVGGTLVSTVTEIAPNDGTTYDVSVTGMSASNGTVVATIGSNVTVESNQASTSTDNVVTFNGAVPEIEVWDGATNLTDGSSTVDFGSTVACNPAQKTFTVKNIGNSNLTLTEPISLPAGYSLVSSFGSTTVAAAGSTTFTVKLTDTTLAGTFSGALSFANNDSDENPFNFTITTTVTNPTTANVQVFSGTAMTLKGTYPMAKSAAVRLSYGVVGTTGLTDGPMWVKSDTCNIASQRVIFNEPLNPTLPVRRSYNEMMGFPGDKLTTSYVFPWYDNVNIDSQFRFANLGASATTITINVAGSDLPTTYPLAAGAALRVSVAGVNNGPVSVSSSGGMPIVATIRVIFTEFGFPTYPIRKSNSEMTGFPANQLTTSYTFPWYNNLDIDSQFRIGNLGASATNVTINVAGTDYGPYPLAANAAAQVSLPTSVSNGPVTVSSSGGMPIVVSIVTIFDERLNPTLPKRKSYDEFMGFPTSQLTTAYAFPWYNGADVDSQLRFANLGASATVVTVNVNGVDLPTTYPLAAGAAARVSLGSISNGVVKISSSGGMPIIVAMRTIFTEFGNPTYPTRKSFTEMMGFPMNQMTKDFVFPWYNNHEIDTQLRFAYPIR